MIFFSEKWKQYETVADKEVLYELQKNWHLELYGFDSETELAMFLQDKKCIFDAGCGLGHKAVVRRPGTYINCYWNGFFRCFLYGR